MTDRRITIRVDAQATDEELLLIVISMSAAFDATLILPMWLRDMRTAAEWRDLHLSPLSTIDRHCAYLAAVQPAPLVVINLPRDRPQSQLVKT